MKIERTPLFFGSDARPLFGWFHVARDAALRNIAAVVCPPFGHEYINSHRPVRHLTDALAAAGIPALRFDYDGTGDSAGADEDPGRVAAWAASIRTAMARLRELSQRDEIALVGVRFGATLAALVAQDAEVAALVLWAPALRGRAYLRELKALHLTGAGRDAPQDGSTETIIEPGGFVVTEETQRDIGAIEIDHATLKAKRTLVLPRDGVDDMFLPPHRAVVPHARIAEIAQWVAGE